MISIFKRISVLLIAGILFTGLAQLSLAQLGELELTNPSEEHEQQQEQIREESKQAVANEIINIQCPAGTYIQYISDTSATRYLNMLFNLTEGDTSRPVGCITKGGYKNVSTQTCEEWGMVSGERICVKSKTTTTPVCDNPQGAKYYSESGQFIGCLVPSTEIKVTRQGAIGENPNIGKENISPYVTKVQIPCNTTLAGGECPVADNPAGYVARLYQFGLMVVGLVALGAMIYGAALYTLSAGNIASKEDAKDWMMSAIYGILLLLGAYLILYTINPKLVSLENPALEPIDLSTMLGKQIYVAGTTTPTTNTPSETGGIEGCIEWTEGKGGFGTQAVVNGQVVGDTSNSGVVCKKCTTGYNLQNNKCIK